MTPIMNPFWTEIVAFATQTTQRVGARLLTEFGTVAADEKGDGSLVTRSDQWADQELRDAIARTFPAHSVLSEEAEHVLPDTDWCWVIDPIDGTTNFTRGIPIWAISLGLLYKGTPVFGMIYLPTLNQRFHGFWAAPDQENGAFSNDLPIQVRPDAPGSNQFFSFCARSIQCYRKPFPCKVRMLGASTYNLLSVGAGIAIGAVEATPKVWDIAGIWPISQAAGATWIALDGQTLFPLKTGEDYRQKKYPTLVVSQAVWSKQFLPFLQPLIQG
jgi:myo-inositol-1(or 4)-monophosphatase